MPTYDLRVLRKDNLVINVQQLSANEDAEAYQKARQLLDGKAIEIWEEALFIATLEPEDHRATRDG